MAFIFRPVLRIAVGSIGLTSEALHLIGELRGATLFRVL